MPSPLLPSVPALGIHLFESLLSLPSMTRRETQTNLGDELIGLDGKKTVAPALTIIGLKTLPNFSQEFLSNNSQVKRIRYLEIPARSARPSARPNPLQLDGVSRDHDEGRMTTDTGRRIEKLKRFENECSWAIDHVYFGGEAVARNMNILRANSITHVVNCVRLEHTNYFSKDLEYMGLYLQDSGNEDILCVLYDVFDFIEEAERKGGRVFVHCSQGVSRSSAIVIAYAMWRTGKSFDIVKAEMKEKRGVVDPNAGFSLQLMFWEQRIFANRDQFNIYRIRPQSRCKPTYLVPRLLTRNDREHILDPRGACVLIVQKPRRAVLWVGKECPDAFSEAGRRFMAQLKRYEHVKISEVRQGHETSDVYNALGIEPGSEESKKIIGESDDFTQEYNMYQNALTPRSSVTEGIRPRVRVLSPVARPPIPNFRRCQSEPFDQ
ncbi:hypothetical protein BSKO_09675 [Bryopsis sp. KO-2023]|nr:hypothetical protein BSKO_09675 [Bryopsis sp. KO-2023]